MAKQGKVLRARAPKDRSREESLLLRSAESLGRIIGALQRQLDQAARSIGNGKTRSSTPKRRRAKPKAARKRKIAR